MADDAQEIVGTWTVKFMKWIWEYTFTADGNVKWRDPLNNEKGSGRWAVMGKFINLSWAGSTTAESWTRPIKSTDQSGWYAASYGTGAFKANKKAPDQSMGSPALATANYDKPSPISQPETVVPKLDPRSILSLGGIWGDVRAGQTWLATDGSRLIWSADGMQVVYSIGNRFFVQSARGFRGEVTTYPLIEGARRAAPMARLAEIEMKLLMGVVAGASGLGFAAVVGVEVLAFVAENQQNFEKWKRQLQIVLKVRDTLKSVAPTLYDKLFSAVLRQVWKDVKGQLPDAVTAETVAFAVGVIVGSVGKAASKGKFTIMGVIFAVLKQIVIRFSLNVAPTAIKLTAVQYATLAQEIIKKLREVGVMMSEWDARKILDEAEKHPREIIWAFEQLRAEFQ